MRHDICADYAFQNATNATSHDFTKSQRVAIAKRNTILNRFKFHEQFPAVSAHCDRFAASVDQ